LYVYDLATKLTTSQSTISGIPVDEININHFEDSSTCLCTSKTIKDNGGTCSAINKGYISGVCEQDRDITDGTGTGFLHKPKSENSNAIVNLFSRSDDPYACWYENSSNTKLGEAYFSYYSNPDRPTFRPTHGESCSSFPDNMIIACNVAGQKHCWHIPDPCTRYD